MFAFSLLLFFLPFICALEAIRGDQQNVITIPFYSTDYSLLRVNLTFGIPAQNVTFDLIPDAMGTDLYVINATNGGAYDSSASAAFLLDEVAYDSRGDDIGWVAEDFVRFGSLLEYSNFVLYNYEAEEKYEGYSGFWGLNRPINGNKTFIKTLLADVYEQVVTFSYNSYNKVFLSEASGRMTLGGRDPDRCSSDWTIVPEFVTNDQYEQWTFNLDDFEFGKYLFDDPGYAYVDVDSPWAIFPEKFRTLVESALKLYDDLFIPCDTSVNFIFTVDGKEIRIEPEDYIYEVENAKPNCAANIIFQGDHFHFSSTFFRKYCLLYSYNDTSVGFTNRLN